MVPPLLYPVRTSEHLAGIYIVCLEAERNIEPPEEVQHDSQGYEQGTGVGQHHTAQGTDAGIFVIFLAINDNQGIESEHRCADVDGGVTDTECGLGQFRGNADGHEHGYENRCQDGPFCRCRRDEQIEEGNEDDDPENGDLRRQSQGFQKFSTGYGDESTQVGSTEGIHELGSEEIEYDKLYQCLGDFFHGMGEIFGTSEFAADDTVYDTGDGAEHKDNSDNRLHDRCFEAGQIALGITPD